MAPWVLQSSSEVLGRTFTRPLGINELGFYYDACFNLIADVYFHCELETRSDTLFHYDNIVRAWTALKQRYPLIGAKFQGEFGSDAVQFVVSEKALAGVDQGELFFDTLSSAEDVQHLVEEMVRGPPRNFHDLPTRLFVIRQSDRPHRWHIIFNFNHCSNDGTASAVVCCKFFDLLSLRVTPIVPELEERLSMVVPAEDLNPTRNLTTSRQRWRRAMAHVLWNIRESKVQGGYTLPRKMNDQTYVTRSVGKRTQIQFPASVSATILRNCRRNEIHLGAVIAVLAHMATARVLHRRYLRGEIPEQEWDYIKRQPTRSRGPLNTRPYLDKDWYTSGGSAEVFVALTYFWCTLPAFPSPPNFSKNSTYESSGGAPPFADLLSHDRFIRRCNMLRNEMREQLKHPLLMDISEFHQRDFLARKKNIYLHWRDALNGETSQNDIRLNGLKQGLAYTYEWTTIGDWSAAMPSEYPLPSKHHLSSQQHPSQRSLPPEDHKDSERFLRVIDTSTTLLTRATDLYLSAVTVNGEIRLLALSDANVYPNDLTAEWLDEIKAAAEWYLGGEGDEYPRGKL